MNRGFFAAIVLLMPLSVWAAQGPDAAELLKRFADNQARLQSFIGKSENTTEQVVGGKVYRSANLNEFRADAKTGRFVLRITSWIVDGKDPSATKENPRYASHLWDSTQYYSYAHGFDQTKDQATIDQTGAVIANGGYLQRLRSGFPGAPYMGYFEVDDERIDVAFQKAKSLTVRAATEQVNQSDCYVVEAVTAGGKYTIWLDPQHGYNIAQAQVLKSEGDVVLGKPFGKDIELRQVVKGVRFEQVNGVWVPMEGDSEVIRKGPAMPGGGSVQMVHHKKSEITLEPKFDALNSFVPDDIREGTKVFLFGTKGLQYIWRGGKLVPYIETQSLKQIDKDVEQMKLQRSGALVTRESATAQDGHNDSKPASSQSIATQPTGLQRASTASNANGGESKHTTASHAGTATPDQRAESGMWIMVFVGVLMLVFASVIAVRAARKGATIQRDN